MDELLATSVVFAVAAVAFAVVRKRYAASEAPYIAASFIMHVASVFAIVWITRAAYSGGDMFMYYETGRMVASFLDLGFWEHLPSVFGLILQEPVELPFRVYGLASSTATMTGIAGLLLYFLNGSLYAACAALAMASFFGKLALYEAFRGALPSEHQPRVLLAILLLPSVVFWSTGIVKESVVITGVGLMCYGLHRQTRGFRVVGVLVFAMGFVAVALVKAYVLFSFVLGMAAWVYGTRLVRGERPATTVAWHFLLAASLAIGGLAVLGSVFPQYALENVAGEMAYQQEVGERAQGGSSYSIGNPEERTLAGQLAYVPMGMAAAFLRPFPFEVKNAAMLASALETTLLLMLSLRALWLRGFAGSWHAIRTSNALLFCLAVSLVLAAGVGLATTNLGTLSRYRIPMMPFYAMLVMVLSSRSREQQSATAQNRFRWVANAGSRPPAGFRINGS